MDRWRPDRARIGKGLRAGLADPLPRSPSAIHCEHWPRVAGQPRLPTCKPTLQSADIRKTIGLPEQAIEERDYKLQASQLFKALLDKDSYAQLLNEKDYPEIIKRIAQCVNFSTNFIQGSFEKPILLDTINKNSERYCTALYNLIYGNEPEQERIESFIQRLDELSLLKWTYFSYFLFLSDTDKYMFVKPEMLKRSLEICRYPLSYTNPSQIINSTKKY